MNPTREKIRCLSRYERLRQLGSGPLTRIFLCARRTPEGGRLATLELMQDDLARIDDFRALFLDQAAGTLALRHPQLLRTEEVVADAEACGISTEFLHGQTLARVLERLGRGRFPVDVHLAVLRQALAGLEHAHHHTGPGGPRDGFVHGNICPSNVFITYDGQVKLLGVGFCDALSALERRLGRPLIDLRYAAPELLRGRPASRSADLFSFGQMLWEAITQKPRAADADGRELNARRNRGEEPDLESIWPDAPQVLVELCRRALAVDPAQRYTQAAALREALDAYLGKGLEPSAAALGRLPELMANAFGEERFEMQLFIDLAMDSLAHEEPEESSPWAEEEDATPHDAEWSAETRSALPSDAAQALSDVLEQPLPLSRLVRDTDPDALASLPAPPAPPAPSPLLAPVARRDSDTGGHRAFSASLPAPPLGAGGTRAGRHAGIALLMLVAPLTVAAVLHYARQGERRAPAAAELAEGARPVRASVTPAVSDPPAPVAPPVLVATPAPQPSEPAAAEADDLEADAPQPEAEAPAEPSGEPAPEPSNEPVAEPGDAPDAGASSAPVRPASPAFFDGRAAGQRADEPPALSLDDLPAVDEARDSLQDAILSAARSRRAAARHKRMRRPAPAAVAPEEASASPFPRSIDEADPYSAKEAP